MQPDQETINIVRQELSRAFYIPFGDNGMADDTNLVEANMIDSFGLVELVVFLESRFNIHLSDEEMMSSDLASVAGIAALVRKKQS
jgi:acyl carrier protein